MNPNPENLIGVEGCKFVASYIRKATQFPIWIDYHNGSSVVRIAVHEKTVVFIWLEIGFDIELFDKYLPQPDSRFNADGFPIYAPTKERLQRYVNELREHQLNGFSIFHDFIFNVTGKWELIKGNPKFTFISGETKQEYYYTAKEIRDCLTGKGYSPPVLPTKPAEYPLIFTEKELNDF